MSGNYTTNDFKFSLKEISVSEICSSIIWRHKWWYFASLVICLSLSVFHLYKTPKQYVRTLKVMVDESTQDAALRNLGVASAGMYRMRTTNSIENEVEAFASPDLMEEVVQRLDLQTSYFENQFARSVELYQNSPIKMILVGDNVTTGFSLEVEYLEGNEISVSDFRFGRTKDQTIVSGNLGDTLATPVGKLVFYPTPMLENFKHPIRASWTSVKNAAKVYDGRLKVSLTGKESSVIALTMTETYPNRAELVLNTLLDVYNEVWVRNKNRAAIATTNFINQRLVVIENELNIVENSLKEFKESNNLTDLEAVAQIQIKESSEYSAKAFQVSNQLSIANFIKDYLNDPKNTLSLIPSNVGLNSTSSSVDGQIKEYNDLLLQRDRLLSGSSTSNPLVMDLTTSLQSMRAAILRSTENLIATLEMQQEKIQSEERQIASQMTSNTGQAFELLSIERDQKIKQELYVFLLQKREENELAALVNVGNTRLIMNPNGSNSPVSPISMMVFLLAVLLGCGIPFIVFMFIKVIDNKIKTREDLNGVAAPFLAEIPHYSRATSWVERGWHIKRNRNDDQYGIIVESGKRDSMNEAYRVLRTNIDMMMGQDNTEGKVIMITSFVPGSGKSVTIKNLAATMALKNAKVLLVDLDLRKSSLSQSLGLNHSGIASYLNGKHDDFKSLCDEVSPNLHVLPVGSLPPNPSEFLLSDRFKMMIGEARKSYDYIFLDCPPVEMVVDSRIITEVVDMTIFVLRAGLIDKSVLPVLNDLYEKDTYRHMAVILNDVQLEYKKYGYGRGGYGYGYGYGYGN